METSDHDAKARALRARVKPHLGPVDQARQRARLAPLAELVARRETRAEPPIDHARRMAQLRRLATLRMPKG